MTPPLGPVDGDGPDGLAEWLHRSSASQQHIDSLLQQEPRHKDSVAQHDSQAVRELTKIFCKIFETLDQVHASPGAGTEQRSTPAPVAPGWVRLSALLQGSALLEALRYDALAPLLCDQERRTTLTALALLALKFSSTEVAWNYTKLTKFTLGNAVQRQMLLYCQHLHCEIAPSAEAWLNIYETRLRATRPKASVEAQWISDQSRWSMEQKMQNGHNEVPRKFSLIHFVHNYERCLEECQGRLGDDERLERHELLWVVGCESVAALEKSMEV